LQRVASVSAAGLPPRPRAALDEHAWAELHRLCPARRTSPAIDLKLAERVLADPKLYGEALKELPAATSLAQNSPTEQRRPGGRPGAMPGAMPEPALTGPDRTLSSRSH
jgi:hypothetical protein